MRAVLIGLLGAVLATAPALAMGGEYKGSGSESGGYKWQLYAKIAPAGAGKYNVSIAATNRTCA
jgi:hypothetical protein